MKKPAVPPIEPRTGRQLVMPLHEQAPMAPRGTSVESWGGAMAVDHRLQLWDVGDSRASCVAHVDDLSARDRRVIAEYQIALWQAFRDWKA